MQIEQKKKKKKKKKEKKIAKTLNVNQYQWN